MLFRSKLCSLKKKIFFFLYMSPKLMYLFWSRVDSVVFYTRQNECLSALFRPFFCLRLKAGAFWIASCSHHLFWVCCVAQHPEGIAGGPGAEVCGGQTSQVDAAPIRVCGGEAPHQLAVPVPLQAPQGELSSLQMASAQSEGRGGGGGGGYAFYSISSLTIPVVWLVIVFVLADWWWPVFGGGVVFLPKFINLYYAVYAATAAFMTLAFTDGSWKKENEKKKSNNLLSTELAMSTKQGSARSLKACMVLVDTALLANCSLANYCYTFYFFHFQHLFIFLFRFCSI